MPKNFQQYYLIETLGKKYSHVTYQASPIDSQRGHGESEPKVILTVFATSLFRLPREYENLLQKVRRIKQLQHQYLLPILDVGMEQEQPFVVREYLPNDSLRSYLKKISPDRLKLSDALTIVSQVGQALVYAHEQDVVHGSVKPENIFVDDSGRAILTDFYLVDRKEAIIRDQISEEYAFCYMAPEQFTGITDAKSDQYALGCLAYELITGCVPFASRALSSMIGGLANNVCPAPPSETIPDLLPSLETAILKALARDPAERFFDFSLFLEVIQSVLSSSPAFPFANVPRESAIANQLVEDEDVSFSISNHTPSSNDGFQPQEATETVDVAEPVGIFSISQAGMPEEEILISELLKSVLQSSQFPFPLAEEVYPIEDREGEQEAGDLLVTDALVQQQADAESEKVLLLTKSPDMAESQPAQPLYSRKRGLKLAALLSVIIIVAASAFWVSGMSASDTSSHTTSKITQAVIMQTIVTHTLQPSVQASSVSTVQPTTRAITVPTAHPISVSTVAPASTPTPTAPITYEATDPQNTLGGGARVASCSVCSNGQRVAYIGLNGGSVGTLQFNNVSKNVAGQYTLTVYYIMAGSDKPQMYISVNGASPIVLNVPDAPNGDTIITASATVSLNAGSNTIEFYNPSVPAPDMDRIVV